MKPTPSTKAALELAPIAFPNSKSRANLPPANQIALTSALISKNPNTNSSSQLTIVPPTPNNPFSDNKGYQSSTLDIIQSTNATLSPKMLN